MKNRNVWRGAIAVLSLMALVGHAAQPDKNGAGQVSKSDRSFMTSAAQGGMTEVELGKLAQQKGRSDGIKRFGKRLEDDHSKANNELSGIAQKLGATLPASLDKKHQGVVDKLSKAKAQDFDRQFARQMVGDHEQTIKSFRKEADKGDSAELKQFASETLPTLEEHLKMARDLSGSTKTTKGSK